MASAACILDFNTPPTSFGIVDEIPPEPDTRVTLEDHEAAVDAAYKRGVESVKQGEPYMIDVVTQPR